MNAKCVVLAADSAATVGNKIYRTDKIFKLSRRQPIAIMSYGNADISGMPLELLVNEYRSKLGDRTFSSIKECVKDFIGFLERGGADDFTKNPFITKDHIDQRVRYIIRNLWDEITDGSFRKFVSRIYSESDSADKNIGEVFEGLKGDLERDFKKILKDAFGGVDPSEVSAMASKVRSVMDSSFIEQMDGIDSHFKFSDYLNEVTEIVASMIASGKLPDYTGIVIAGYGSDEYAPSYYEYAVYGLFYDGLKCSETNNVRIDHNTPSWINTFAQDDVVQSYLYGIDEELRAKIAEDLREMLYLSTDEIIGLTGASDHTDHLKKLNDRLVEKYEGDLLDYTYINYMNPIESAVEFLSKDEMTLMAESMINFMSLKKRISDEVETVGGPVDVAVISRNEGLVWIKRKHYFNMELNPHYKRCRYVC